MGFGSSIGYVVFFIGIISIAMIMTVNHSEMVQEKESSINTQSYIHLKKGNTQINIVNVLFNTENVSLMFKNTGMEKLHLDKIGVYANNTRLLSSEYNISILDETNLINPILFDTDEILNITILKNFSKGDNHTISVSVENGFTKNIMFFIKDYNTTINNLNPEAWWILGSDGNDYSGNGHNPDNTVSTPTFESSILKTGPSETCLLIDNSPEGYNYPDSLEINTYANPNGDYWALSGWFNADSIPANNGNIIYEQGGGTNSIAVYTFNDAGTYKVFCSAVEGGNEDFVQYNIDISETYHIGCIWDVGNGKIEMYINGELVDTDSTLAIGTDLARHTGDTAIGENDGNPDNHLGNQMTNSFQGNIADIVLWGVNDDGAVSEEDFLTIYKTGMNIVTFWEID